MGWLWVELMALYLRDNASLKAALNSLYVICANASKCTLRTFVSHLGTMAKKHAQHDGVSVTECFSIDAHDVGYERLFIIASQRGSAFEITRCRIVDLHGNFPEPTSNEANDYLPILGSKRRKTKKARTVLGMATAFHTKATLK